jgi:hypothetical protein
MAYQQGAIRRGGATPEASACRRNPSVEHQGRAEPRRRPALLVARVLVFEYATLLAPCPACGSARRGRGRLRDGL